PRRSDFSRDRAFPAKPGSRLKSLLPESSGLKALSGPGFSGVRQERRQAMKQGRLAGALLLATLAAGATAGEGDVLAHLDAYATRQAEVGRLLWQQPELGYLEERSSRLLQQ